MTRPSLSQMGWYEFYHIVEVSPGVHTPGLESLVPLQAPVL
jgi:hypothetical protein